MCIYLRIPKIVEVCYSCFDGSILPEKKSKKNNFG